jgi:DNA-binding transcriptional LysR family regulator
MQRDIMADRQLRFTLKQIDYFVAAAESGSITLASEQVHISQPSISAAISALEQEFGIQLFIRHHAQGLSLTPQGQRFLREAKVLLLQAEELQAAATEISTKVGGQLDIGCLVTLYPLVVPELLQAFKQRHDNARINAVADDHIGLIEKLRRGDISLALTYDLSIPPDVAFMPLAKLPPFAFVASRHKFGKRKSITLRELAEEPFLQLDLPISRDYFLSLFSQAGVTPTIGGRFGHIDVIRSLVARGEGYGLANAQPRNRSSLDGHPLSYLALEGDLKPLVYGVAVMGGMRRTHTSEAFLQLCQETMLNQPLPGTIA